jgi:hypothetical protein
MLDVTLTDHFQYQSQFVDKGRSPFNCRLYDFFYVSIHSTSTCFIQKIYAPSSSLLQGKHLPFPPSPLRLNIFRLFVIPDNDQANERPNCMKRFWTFIKHRRSDGRQIPPLKSDGTFHSEPTEKADILNGQFQKAFSEKNQHIKAFLISLYMSFKFFKFGFISTISRYFLPFIPSIPLSYKTLDVWCYPRTTILFPCNLFGYIYLTISTYQAGTGHKA